MTNSINLSILLAIWIKYQTESFLGAFQKCDERMHFSKVYLVICHSLHYCRKGSSLSLQHNDNLHSSLINLIIPKNCTPHVALIRGSRHLLLYVYVKASDMNSIILAFISLKTTWISPLHLSVNQRTQAAVKN